MSIPVFPQSALIDSDSKPCFDAACRHTGPASSDMVFSSLFGWQNYFNYQFCAIDRFLLVYYLEGNTMVFLPPFLKEAGRIDDGYGAAFLAVARTLAAYARENNYVLQFRYMPEVLVRLLPANAFTVDPDRDSADYIYEREQLVSLQGQDLAPKRNLIQQFKKLYRYAYEPITSANRAAVGAFIDRWHGDRRHEMLGTAAHCLACRFLSKYDELSICGGILNVDGEIVAATMGTIVENFLHEDGPCPTAVVHHENALIEFKGAYQMINQQFCAHLPSSVRYVDREEDLGIAGLRKAKLSYHPARMVNKYTLRVTV